nr:MAG TPA: hypothetical protein [Caudoviricetes sp.]
MGFVLVELPIAIPSALVTRPSAGKAVNPPTVNPTAG